MIFYRYKNPPKMTKTKKVHMQEGERGHWHLGCSIEGAMLHWVCTHGAEGSAREEFKPLDEKRRKKVRIK
jgi:hypothetical protein